MDYYIIYDIADPKRLAKVARILKDYGVRKQKSKFEAELTDHQLRSLQKDLADTIEGSVDGVKYFPLCQRCRGKCEVLGKGSEDRDFYHFEIL